MKALILVDIQNDFAPTGALPVPEGDQIVPVVNNLMDKFELVVATQDWHPRDHKSFAIHHHKDPGETIRLDGIPQLLWPVYCVRNRSRRLHPRIAHRKSGKNLQKGLGSRGRQLQRLFR